ncbi:F0F1 ATP synthase subunit B [Patescibacteria group bacterium]|nr:F0F1 ATP synthase subunit B [Patescibacteria group bacterium]
MELLNALGIDWKLLVAQIVNFLVIMAVLYKFVYKPLMDFLNKRQDRISSSLEQTRQMEENLKQLEAKKEEMIIEAKKQSQLIISQAEKEAVDKGREVMIKVKQEAALAIESARQAFATEQQTQIQVLRQQAAKLVTSALAKIVGKAPAQAVDADLIKEAVEEAGKKK